LALHHPATYSEVDEAARPVLEELQRELTSEELKVALEKGKALDLDQVVDEILAAENIEDYLLNTH